MRRLWVGIVLAAASAAAGEPDFDPAHPPAAVGESLSQVLARWGGAAYFGADCGSWRGPSVDTRLRWRGEELRVMALLKGDRVTAMRYERRAGRSDDFAQCLSQLNAFAEDWKGSGIDVGEVADTQFDGPVMRAVRSATRPGMQGGSFEADYRASRAECRVALVY